MIIGDAFVVAYPRDPDYGVTRDGRVFRIRQAYKSRKAPFEMKVRPDKDGYLIWGLRKRTYKVHRAVAETFIPGASPYLHVAHKNGVRSDNRVENLIWCDAKVNALHKRDHGTQLVGSQMTQSKLTETKVLEARRRYVGGESLSRLAPEFGVARATLGRAVNGRTWKHV